VLNSFDTLNRRFPILATVIKYLHCEEQEKKLLQELFLEVYNTGYEDAEKDLR